MSSDLTTRGYYTAKEKIEILHNCKPLEVLSLYIGKMSFEELAEKYPPSKVQKRLDEF